MPLCSWPYSRERRCQRPEHLRGRLPELRQHCLGV
jgi:hypothetical protein